MTCRFNCLNCNYCSFPQITGITAGVGGGGGMHLRIAQSTRACVTHYIIFFALMLIATHDQHHSLIFMLGSVCNNNIHLCSMYTSKALNKTINRKLAITCTYSIRAYSWSGHVMSWFKLRSPGPGSWSL